MERRVYIEQITRVNVSLAEKLTEIIKKSGNYSEDPKDTYAKVTFGDKDNYIEVSLSKSPFDHIGGFDDLPEWFGFPAVSVKSYRLNFKRDLVRLKNSEGYQTISEISVRSPIFFFNQTGQAKKIRRDTDGQTYKVEDLTKDDYFEASSFLKSIKNGRFQNVTK